MFKDIPPKYPIGERAPPTLTERLYMKDKYCLHVVEFDTNNRILDQGFLAYCHDPMDPKVPIPKLLTHSLNADRFTLDRAEDYVQMHEWAAAQVVPNETTVRSVITIVPSWRAHWRND